MAEAYLADRVDRFSGLPAHILIRIAQAVDTKKTTRYLAALGGTCRSLAIAVTPILWHHVKWSWRKYNWIKLAECETAKDLFRNVESLDVKVCPGSLETNADWIVFAKMPILRTLIITVKHDIKAPRQARPSVLLPPSSIVFPVLERMAITGKDLDRYHPDKLRPTTPIESISTAKSFPRVREVILEMPESTIRAMCNVVVRQGGFGGVQKLEIRTLSGSFEAQARLDALAPDAKSVEIFLENWSTKDLLVLPNFDRFTKVRSIKIIMDKDEHSFRFSDILKRNLLPNLVRYHHPNFVRMQSQAGWYDPEPQGAITMNNIGMMVEELGKQLPELKKVILKRLNKKARDGGSCPTVTLKFSVERKRGIVAVKMDTCEAKEPSPLDGEKFGS